MIFTSEKALALHSDSIGKFLQVTRRGWLAAFDDPETTAKMIVAKYQPDLDPGYQALSLREIQKLMTRETGADHPELLLHVNPATVEKNRALLEKYQIAQVPPDSSGLLDLRFQTQPISLP
jgi:ABC-type nitrate/sulfonate/bicarbonate transport system substrate-binding protein